MPPTRIPVDPPTLALASACFVFLLSSTSLAQKIAILRRAPGPLAVLVVGTLVSFLFELPVETIGSRFNGIPQEMPDFGLPALSIHDLGKLISPAITIALLGAIESLLSARVADSQIDDRHDPNQELVAQGLSNIAAPLFGGFRRHRRHRPDDNQRQDRRPACRLPASSTPSCCSASSCSPRRLPPTCRSPRCRRIVMVVAINMGEWHEFAELKRYSYNYRIILLSTFLVTVLFDLTIAVELGMVLASLFFIYRMSELTKIERLPMDEEAHDPRFMYPDGTMRVATWQMFGSLFFGAVNKLEELLDPRAGHPEIVILDMTRLIQLDTTGLEGLENLRDKLQTRLHAARSRPELTTRIAALPLRLHRPPGRRRLPRPVLRAPARLYPAAQPDGRLRRRLLKEHHEPAHSAPNATPNTPTKTASMTSARSAPTSGADAPAAAAEEVKVLTDSVGNVLQDGDTVTVIKDLKVKGSSAVVKVGTKVKNIRLSDGDHDIDCKIDGIGAMKLKSEFVKKA